jgi:hypothetical protein
VSAHVSPATSARPKPVMLRIMAMGGYQGSPVNGIQSS